MSEKKKKPTILHEVNNYGRQDSNKTLARCRSLKPTQVVVWYRVAGSETGVLISEGTNRVTAAGALTVAAMDVWNA